MKTAFTFSAIAFAAALVLAPGAEAGNKSDQQHGNKQGHKALLKVEPSHGSRDFKKSGRKHDDDDLIEIETKHRHNVLQIAGPKDCPPGLAKKDNGCLPPGQAKKLHGATSDTDYIGRRYRIGDRFDNDEPYFVLRRNEYERYGVPAFDDQYYVRTEDSLLRVDRKTDAVIDVITGLTELLNN